LVEKDHNHIEYSIFIHRFKYVTLDSHMIAKFIIQNIYSVISISLAHKFKHAHII